MPKARSWSLIKCSKYYNVIETSHFMLDDVLNNSDSPIYHQINILPIRSKSKDWKIVVFPLFSSIGFTWKLNSISWTVNSMSGQVSIVLLSLTSLCSWYSASMSALYDNQPSVHKCPPKPGLGSRNRSQNLQSDCYLGNVNENQSLIAV